ncbi:MAG: helix-turn-helix domain-containing protein [Azonexaceae bacterium]|uniref:helix-turn-helix domain-containing protein n=1 Tax=Azonexus sp. R2A61 TaxID=2744443 RepID=UPI001F360046|nr:helix-turn-helix domain-containing protein [Azonexus sp. R2A61]MCE1240179.1 helix-turn-helix domain-containing protein [Azonexaceae bacterium]
MPSIQTCRADAENTTPLGELRRELGLSQIALSASLGISQPHVAKIERQLDMHISTLRRYLAGLGGELHLVVTLPGQTREVDLGKAMKTAPDFTEEFNQTQGNKGVSCNRPNIRLV